MLALEVVLGGLGEVERWRLERLKKAMAMCRYRSIRHGVPTRAYGVRRHHVGRHSLAILGRAARYSEELSMPFFLIPTALGICFIVVWAFIGGMILRDGQLAAQRDRESDTSILPLSVHRVAGTSPVGRTSAKRPVGRRWFALRREAVPDLMCG